MVYQAHSYAEPRLALESRLRQCNIHPTGQRLSIASVLLSRHQHVTADTLHERLREAGEQVSKATIYNTLSLFVEKGLIREIVVESGKTYYDSNNTHHHHIFNLDTGELTDTIEPLAERLGSVHIPSGTDLESIDVVVRVRNKPR
jgi:Fur family iron response transcriptional regulator